jgi:uncharacterized protein (DUF58 family)
MLTARGWWVLLPSLAVLLLGLASRQSAIVLIGLALLLWIGYEGHRFTWSLLQLSRRLRVKRTLRDPRGSVRTLLGGAYTVEVRVTLTRGTPLPVVVLTDRVPFAVERTGGITTRACRLDPDTPVEFTYTIQCRHAGIARFEGVQVQLADPQGFFYHSLFVHQVIEYTILPLRADAESNAAHQVPSNRLPPPGQHRLRKPGSSSELLDLRDYQEGDPPRTIAWKVSARRDKLITREFESEVPLRCTLFVDTSSSVRLLSAFPDGQGRALTGRPLHRIVDIAAGVVQAGLANRDLVGLCLFDEQEVHYQRPDRAGRHKNEMLQTLAGTLRTLPQYDRADPDELLPLAYGFARQVYPEQLDPGVNGMPFWAEWVASFPGVWRHPVGLLRYLHRRKGTLLFLIFVVLPAFSMLLNLLAFGILGWWFLKLLAVIFFLWSAVMVVVSVLAFPLILLLTGRERRLARWRKQMAALIAARYDLGAGAVSAMLEDEDLMGLLLQQFLNEHQVPFRVPLYDEQGGYLHAAPGKVKVLTAALQESIRRGQDTELFVLLVDLIELEDHLTPLLKTIRLARSRRHQVLVVVPWPPGLPPPGTPLPPEPDPEETLAGDYLDDWILRANTERFHLAYMRVKRTLARLGVETTCAAEGEPVNLVLSKLDRLRQPRRRAF